nr:hypothetical protein [uncultured Niameybacter sp.]
MNQSTQERNYLIDLVNKIQYDPNNFIIKTDNDKYIFGLCSPNPNDPLSKFFMYKTLFDSIQDIDKKIKYSFEQSLSFAYTDAVFKNFKMFDSSPEEEKAYYYLENALFRTSTLWDLLAQIYNIICDTNLPVDKIKYYWFFTNQSKNPSPFQDTLNAIKAYLDQADNTNTPTLWEGNHTFCNKIRNKMTHRNSPAVNTASNFDFSLKDHPTYLLKRVIEDYYVVSNFIREAFMLIEA